VPLLQKRIIQRANALFKPVITATQMLESMVASPTPTRAEASDVANAVLDGTDAVMLSAETSVGGYPVEAVRIMDRIAAEADGIPGESRLERAAALDPARSVVRAAVGLAGETEARAIVIFTSSGRTAMLMSKHRPAMPIFACTRSAEVCHRLALWRGVVPVQTPLALHTDEMIAYAERLLLERGAAHPRDRVVMVGSAPMTARGRTNFIKVHTVQRPDRRVLGNLGL
jgi:pyruvate kinase